MADRRANALAAYAAQFGIREDEVFEYLASRFGERLAEEAINASGGAWDPDSPLTPRERSLLVIAALSAQGGLEARLRPHVRFALRNGLTRDELEAAATFLGVYVGFARASVALETIRAALDEEESGDPGAG